MKRIAGRLRHAIRLVWKVLAKDIRRLQVGLSDGALRRRHVGMTCEKDGRRLPARKVEMRTPYEHRQEFLMTVVQCLHELGLHPFVMPSPSGWPERVGVLSFEWEKALSGLSGSTLQCLVGEWRKSSPSDQWVGKVHNIDQASQYKATPKVALVDIAVAVGSSDKILAQFGTRHRITLERWSVGKDGVWVSTDWNQYATSIVPAEQGAAELVTNSGQYPTVLAFAIPNIADVTFPIDAVYTWVDGTDPEWAERKRKTTELLTGHDLTEAAAEDLRFVGHDEIKYSLRSIEECAPWVRHIWIVTDRQRPEWLLEGHPRVTVVDHTEISPDGSELPTFNSHAIEANLHRIPGLSEHFLYLNDDMFFSREVYPRLFFEPSGIGHIFESAAQVGGGATVELESASDSAGKNNRELIRELTGKRLTRKLFHAPYPLNVSLTKEIEERWPNYIQFTRESRFRRIGDITLAGALQLQYGYATGRVVPKRIRYRYVDIGASSASSELKRLYSDRYLLDSFCLNESSVDLAPDDVDSAVRGFLEAMYPDKSTFER